MKIELSSPTHLRITWPVYDSAIDAEIRRRLATVPGIEAGRGREAWAPVIQLQRLMTLFEKASYEYRAMQQSDAVARRFYDSLIQMGIELCFDESRGVYVVAGANVSPLLEQLVSERSHALKPFVLEPQPMLQPMPLPQIPRPVQPAIAHLYPKPKRRRAKKEKAKS